MTQLSSATEVLGTVDLNIPAGVDATTPREKELYRASAEFERFFVSYMMKQMNSATDALKDVGSDDENPAVSGSTPDAYKDMINDQMTEAVLSGGGLGIASIIYNQMSGKNSIPTSSIAGMHA